MIAAEGVKRTPISGLFARAYKDILQDRARLPSLPDVAIRLRAAMQNDRYDVRSVARVVQADPGTAAYVVRIANSPIYRGRVATDNVENAISRLGMRTTRNLVTAHALRAMFQTRSAVLATVMRSTWQRSAKVGALAAIIARRCRGFEPDRAMLAGLLQDIGVLPLIKALEASRQSPAPERLAASLDAWCAKVGVVLLRQWGFDEEFVEVARSRNDWLRDPGGKADLADVILVARLHACMGDGTSQPLPALEDLPAFARLPLGTMTLDERLRIVLEADREIRNVTSILGV
jgi:HD-like signal output (HDOD) protein